MWRKIKEHIIYYFDSYLLSLTSIVYGWQLFLKPEILLNYRIYQRIRDLFDHKYIGASFVVLGAIYIVATILNQKKIKQIALPVFTFMWAFFSFSFIMTDPPNTVGVLTMSVAVLSFGISLRGDFKDG